MSLINEITQVEIKKIFLNNTLKKQYLALLSKYIPIDLHLIQSTAVDNVIINTWNYDISKNVLRNLFLESNKYTNNSGSGMRIVELMKEWDELSLGELDWPFQPKMFDQHVHSINRRCLPERQKDNMVAIDAIKYRRIKDINAQRNDYIEYLIYKNNDNVIPTFRNARGVDFYINGEPFDQKVSRSVGKNFIAKYGNNYRQIAIQHPDLVAKCLYEYQDEERFGYEPRLLVVYLDSDLSVQNIEDSIISANLSNPASLEFEYQHSNGEKIKYKTYCYIILLHK